MKRVAGFIGLVIAVVAAIAIFRSRISADFWPPDRSFVGPNLVASVIQWIVVVIVASLLYPPLRHWIEREFGKLHAKLDAHHAERLEQARRHHEEAMTLAHAHHQESMAQVAAIRGATTPPKENQ